MSDKTVQRALRKIEEAKKTQSKRLKLKGNRSRTLDALPLEIGQLDHLEELQLVNLQLSALPPEIGQLTHLKSLLLDGNALTALPPEIGDLVHLEKLVIRKNQLAALPQEIGKLTNLAYLDLRANNLDELPPEIGLCTSLKHLNINENQLSTLPEEIGHLRALEYLELRDNQITELPVEIGHLIALRSIELSGNQIEYFPRELLSLLELSAIYLDKNLLLELPNRIGYKTGLYLLAVRENKLSVLPDTLIHNKYGSFWIDGNPLRTHPEIKIEQAKAKGRTGTFIKVLKKTQDAQLREEISRILVHVHPQDIKKLIKALDTKDAEIRKTFVHILAGMKKPPINQLISTLGHKKKHIYESASQVLIEIGKPVFNPLKKDLEGLQRAPSARVFKVLTGIGEPAIGMLLEIACSARFTHREWVRIEAAKTLGKIGRPAVAPVLEALKKRPASWRDGLTRILREMGRPGIDGLILAFKKYELREEAQKMLINVSMGTNENRKRTQNRLLAALQMPDAKVREGALNVLEKLRWKPDQGQAGALYWMTKGNWSKVRQLGAVARDPLIRALSFQEKKVRNAAVDLLEKLGWHPETDQERAAYWFTKRQWNRCIEVGEGALGYLEGALHLWDIEERIAAADCMGKIGHPKSTVPLIESLQKKEESFLVACIKALGEIGNSDAIPALGAVLNEHIGKPSISKPVVSALKKIEGEPAIVFLSDFLRRHIAHVETTIFKWDKEQFHLKELLVDIITVLGERGASDGVDALVYTLTGSHIDVCKASLIALGHIKSKEAVEPLMLFLQQKVLPDEYLKEAGKKYLARIGTDLDTVTDEEFISWGKTGMAHFYEDTHKLRSYAAWALGTIEDERAVVPLIEGLDEEDIALRKACVYALGRIGTFQGVKPLILLLEDQSITINQAALEALKGMSGEDFGKDKALWLKWYHSL